MIFILKIIFVYFVFQPDAEVVNQSELKFTSDPKQQCNCTLQTKLYMEGSEAMRQNEINNGVEQ